jgi:hypothetical protein
MTLTIIPSFDFFFVLLMVVALIAAAALLTWLWSV